MPYRIKQIYINDMPKPIGLDTRQPVFSWEFLSDEGQMLQKRAQIIVGTQSGLDDCWNSGVLDTDCSIGITYSGCKLLPETRYYVTVNTWSSTGEKRSARTFFETGLLDPTIKAWEGTRWIGAPEYSVRSETISVFTLETTFCIQKGYRAGIVFGANDPRLTDKEKNEYLIAG